jgi:hypothetical protein
VGVECTTCADGVALHVTLPVRLRGCATSAGCFFDQGVTAFWRCGVAYGSPMEIVPARAISPPRQSFALQPRGAEGPQHFQSPLIAPRHTAAWCHKPT